jgi:enolase-phosphatase E1
MIRAVVTDIEGTTTAIPFVHDVLFPYARARLPTWLPTHAHEPDVAAQIAAIGAPSIADAVTTLLAWIDADVKATPLKALQGRLWAEGYADGTLRSHVYPDVAPALRRWHAAGLRLAVYSSGSIQAQKLLFGHTTEGDLTPLFSAWFDTTTGPKRAATSYAAIAAALGLPPSEILFLSDIAEELDAAAHAGLRTTQLVRDGATPSEHQQVTTFAAVAAG